jgi:antimicrobial peptide system SdpB family protein
VGVGEIEIENNDAVDRRAFGGHMLSRVGRFAREWAKIDPWTNVYGLARTLLALATASTLVFSHSSSLFRPAAGLVSMPPICVGLGSAGLFCQTGAERLELGRWIAVAILLLVASGYRPRFTGVLHWWVSFSLQANAVMVDGGDQATAVLTLLLIPVTLTDDRTWHWHAAKNATLGAWEETKRLIARTFLTLARVQVAGIYYHAAVGKTAVAQWADGTALYYWFNNPTFGAPPWLLRLLTPILEGSVTLPLFTWSVILLELALAAALVMPKKRWGLFLIAGIGLHAGIILVHGLVSFGTMMMAALVLYLRPIEQPFAFPFKRRHARCDTSDRFGLIADDHSYFGASP